MDFLYKGSRVGMPVFYHADAHTNLATASLLGPQDVAIAISYSGRTRETVLAAQAARDHGAKVIAITRQTAMRCPGWRISRSMCPARKASCAWAR